MISRQLPLSSSQLKIKTFYVPQLLQIVHTHLTKLILDHVAFIPNGAILPRESGASDKPLQSSSVVPFQSPPSLQKTYNLPNKGPITGMIIPAGITTIVGGGFHGKSTLLRAISLGVWNHIPGDGREYIVTNPTAVPVRSEDGRSVSGVDISPFISDLPGGVTTTKWNSDDASGSTSMAAGVIEVNYALTVLRQACELGSQLLLFDEDLCATNFMIRDEIMRTLVKREPITPLIDRVGELCRLTDSRFVDWIETRASLQYLSSGDVQTISLHP
jgi:predicted ABC-class ATPase